MDQETEGLEGFLLVLFGPLPPPNPSCAPHAVPLDLNRFKHHTQRQAATCSPTAKNGPVKDNTDNAGSSETK